METIARAETYGDSRTKHGDWTGLNVPAFAHMIRLVDRFADLREIKYEIIHDTVTQFESIFAQTVRWLSHPTDPADADVRFPDGSVFRAFFRNVTGFGVRDSASEPCIEAADVLAAIASTLAKSALRAPGDLAPELEVFAKLILPLFQERDGAPTFGTGFWHRRTELSLMLPLFKRDAQYGTLVEKLKSEVKSVAR